MGSQQVVNDRVHASVISRQFDRVCEVDDVLWPLIPNTMLDKQAYLSETYQRTEYTVASERD